MSIIDRAMREVTYLRGALRTLRSVKPIAKHKERTVGDLIDSLAARHGDRLALVSPRESFTYRQMNARANRYARWTQAQGFGKGDAVALLMPNRPDYLCIWFGVAKAGSATALINTNLSGRTLAHCISVAEARAIIVEASMLPAFEAARPYLQAPVAVFVHGESGDPGAVRIDLAMQAFSDADLTPAERPELTSRDRCLYVYTSGTTGLPKAANLNHYRVQLAMLGFAGATAARADDRVYDCMPMYHTVGGICAVGVALVQGGRLVIREKFSAREFWNDIVRDECTVFCYVGEFCRYLLSAPASPADTAHRLRLVFGNGLRPDVWSSFRDRFGLKHILEFYAATESNVSMFNFDSWPGAVGRIPKWLEYKFPFAILQFDVETGAPKRGPDGFCIACAANEAGEIVGQILDDPSRPGARFEGYLDKAATERKILRDVFKKDDAWFSTGDLMRRDERGYYYFVDRIGDTFRWKGENVSTTEVSEAITAFADVKEATVYGVRVNGAEGRAGMAAIVAREGQDFDLAAFQTHLATHLPDYARPLFIRFQDQLDVTSTFKQRKSDLVEQGFDPSRISDRLFFNDRGERRFLPIDETLYGQILAGGRKF